MSEMSEEVQLAEELPVRGPGSRLREAREACKLTLEQAAAQLRMQVRILQALENDDYSSLPGSTFVQGYLRSYSRLLGLPEENILGLAHSSSFKEPTLVSTIAEGKAEVSSSDLPFRLMTLLVLVVMVIGVGWWLSQRELAPEAPVMAAVTAGGEQTLLLPEETLQPQSDATLAGAEAEDTTATALETTPDTSEEEAVAETEEAVPEAEQEQPVIEAPKVTTVAAHTTPPILTAEMPQSLVELEYQADSWSEVSDAAGRKLAYGLIAAGQKLKLRGEAPFKVFLGFAPGVIIYHNGVLYDHKPYHRGDVARFRLGKAEQNRPASGN